MKKSLRLGAIVATATVATLTLASCGFGGGSSSSSGDAKTLNLMVASYSDGTKGEWQQIIKDFEAKNTDIKVNLDVQSWTAINDVIKTLVEATFLVIIVMFIFLQHWRTTLIPAIAVRHVRHRAFTFDLTADRIASARAATPNSGLSDCTDAAQRRNR